MKYVRTKDGKIIDTSLALDSEPTNHNLMRFKSANWLNNGHKQITIKVDNIIAQANTIEDLCDEFVVDVSNDRKFNRNFNLDKCKEYQLYLKSENLTGIIYGAIWTDKGLIYVARMNEKGELELL